MIHAVIPLMRLGGRLEDLLYMVYVHPALPEILRNAARKARLTAVYGAASDAGLCPTFALRWRLEALPPLRQVAWSTPVTPCLGRSGRGWFLQARDALVAAGDDVPLKLRLK